jgi:hypothetical protein
MGPDWEQPLIDRIQNLPYITGVRVRPATSKDPETRVEIRTRQGAFSLIISSQHSYLSQAAVNALLARRPTAPMILLARHISRPTGERLAQAGINFVDQSGNLHLRLGQHYHTLVLGNPDKRPAAEHRRLGAATVQTLFAFLADPSSAALPARQLADLAGVGKTAASEARQRLAADGVLDEGGGRGVRIADPKRLETLFLDGYTHVLRPHVFLGRFRSQERDAERWVARFAEVAQEKNWLWALTGAAGAFELDRYYRSDSTTAFITAEAKTLATPLALLPDKQGPITLLRWFSPLVVRPNKTTNPVAHPWLLYAELLQMNDPRALEAAGEIEKKYLHARSIT